MTSIAASPLTLSATILYHGHIDATTRLLITDRGTPIAVLAPYEEGERRESSARLAAVLSSGHVHPAPRPFRADPPLVRGRGKPASEILSEMG